MEAGWEALVPPWLQEEPTLLSKARGAPLGCPGLEHQTHRVGVVASGTPPPSKLSRAEIRLAQLGAPEASTQVSVMLDSPRGMAWRAGRPSEQGIDWSQGQQELPLPECPPCAGHRSH